MSFDYGRSAIGYVMMAFFLLAGMGALSCAAFFVWVVVKLFGMLP